MSFLEEENDWLTQNNTQPNVTGNPASFWMRSGTIYSLADRFK